MTPTLYVGCPMWSHRAWSGRWWPKGDAAGELRAYAHWCNAVEGNTTHYAVPAPGTVQRWAESVGEHFRFVFKLPKSMTHERRLRGVDAELAAFCRVLEPIAPQCGPLAIQLPATFGPSELGVLAGFVRGLPGDWQWALEVRHPAWFGDAPAAARLEDLCRSASVDRTVLDSRVLFSRPPTTPAEREAWERKPRVPMATTNLVGHPVLRLIGVDDPEQARAMWEPWIEPIVSWLRDGATPYVFVHTPDNVVSPVLARELHAAVAAHVPELDPLPAVERLRSPEQAQLF